MKKLIILLLALTATVSNFAQSKKEIIQKSKMDTTAKFLYTCPMHPKIISDKSGKCPKCGMVLVKRKVDKIYTCTMHPEVLSDKPGQCPKCGMELVEKNSSSIAKEKK